KRLTESAPAAAMPEAGDSLFQLLQRRQRLLPPHQGVAHHDEFASVEGRGELAPGIHGVDCAEPVPLNDSDALAIDAVPHHTGSPGASTGPGGGDVHQICSEPTGEGQVE